MYKFYFIKVLFFPLIHIFYYFPDFQFIFHIKKFIFFITNLTKKIIYILLLDLNVKLLLIFLVLLFLFFLSDLIKLMIHFLALHFLFKLSHHLFNLGLHTKIMMSFYLIVT